MLCLLAKAIAKSRGIDFRSHEDIRQWINTEKDIWGISKDYRKAEEMSREARYEGRLFNAEDIRRFNGWYCSVRRHLVDLLKSAGVSVPSLKLTVFRQPAGSGISVNLLSLDVPVLLTMANIPTGTYEEAELRLNPANASIHFTDGTTAPLLIAQEGEDEAELEFEFFPLLTVSSSGVSNAVIDFAPVVTLSGSNYVLGHDHDNDNTGEVENVDEAEVEGSFVSQNGDDITLNVNGKTVHVDISGGGTEFKVDNAAVNKSAFLAALSPGVEVKAEGQFSNDALIARQVEIKNENEGGHHSR